MSSFFKLLFLNFIFTHVKNLAMAEDEFDDIPVSWLDDTRHPRRLEREPVDYVEKSLNLADQFAAIIGGYDGAVDLATSIHDELEEIFGNVLPEQKERKKERSERFKKLLPLFDPTAESKPTSAEEYNFDLGDGSEKTHTAKDLVLDALKDFKNYMKSRPTVRIFDDEL